MTRSHQPTISSAHTASITSRLHPDLPRGVTALTEALAAGRLSAVEVANAYLDRIAKEDGAINSFIRVEAESALAQAQASDARRARGAALGLLDGIPIAVKDNIDIAGLPTTGGIAHYRDNIAKDDAEVIRRLRAAGCVFLGKLNMHEGALGATNDNPWFGRCENPRRPGHTPGGSSGGSGAAVAAGFCAAALGSDTMGSVRVPAAYCGVVGYKPARGAIPTTGEMPLSWTLDHVGVLGLSVADVRLVAEGAMSATTGTDQPTPQYQPPHEPLTLGVPTLTNVEMEPAIAHAFAACLEDLKRTGVRIIDLDFSSYAWTRLRREGLLISEIEGAAVHAAAIEQDPQGFSEEFRNMLAFGARQTAVRTALAYRSVSEAGEFIRAQVAKVDALLLPTTPQAAFAWGAPVPANQADLTALANFAGLPSVALPFGAEAAGAGFSAQLVGSSHRALMRASG
ncbi:MAG: amidase [Burkholderiales bacterium]|nr:amidase [Burkholderiales bacterium]